MALHRKPKPSKEVALDHQSTVYPWADIRSAFIEGIPTQGEERHYPTLKEVSEIFEVPYGRVRKVAAQERWTHKKEAAEMVAIQERLKKRAKMVARNALDFDEKAFNASKLGIAMVTTRLAEIAKEVQLKQPLREDALNRMAAGQPYTKEELFSAVRAGELTDLAAAAERFQNIGMKALGTDVQRVDVTGMGDNTTVNVLNVTQEIQRDDAERLAAMMEAMGEAGMLPPEVLDTLVPNRSEKGDIVDAEVVNENTSDCDHRWEEREELAYCPKCGVSEEWEDEEYDDDEDPDDE